MGGVETFILDGIWGRPRRWEPLRATLEDRVGPATIYRYDCSGFVSFEELGGQLATAIRSRGAPVNLVGYSMGGLVIRSAHLVDSSLPIRRAAFMNSPHGGSWLACLLPLAGVRQMRPFDPYMKRLAAHTWDVPTLTIWNPVDGIIVPGRNTRWDGAGEHVRCGVPIHYWPILSKPLQRRVVEFLAAGEASEPATPATTPQLSSRGSLSDRGISARREATER